MIIDRFENVKQYANLGKNFETAVNWLSTLDVSKLEAGKIEVDGLNVHANVLDIEPKTDATSKWEAHKSYADIQFLIDGSERIGYAHISRTKEVSFDEAKDFITLDAKADFYVRMYPMGFAILFPHDAHQPALAGIEGSSDRIKKMVVKVKLS